MRVESSDVGPRPFLIARLALELYARPRNCPADYDLISLAADARVTLDANLVGLQVPRTSEAASWEPNVVYEELQWCTLTCISEERREEAINRLLKPAAPPDSGNGVVVPHEAPDGPPKPKKKGKK